MQMTLDQARFLRDYLLADYEWERQSTRRVFAALPSDRLDYRPDPKAKSAIELAWHIASSELFFMDGLLKGQFGTDEPAMPAEITSGAALIAWYDRALAASLAQLQALDGDNLVRPVDFFGIFQHPAIQFLSLLLTHSVHHRGQLATYLRPMGGKVPAILGPSADTPMPGAG